MTTTTAAVTTLLVVLAVAGAYCLGYRTCARVTAVRLARIAEAAARPASQRPGLEDGVVAVALAAACCERWWTSAGAEHEPTTCTRKDHHA